MLTANPSCALTFQFNLFGYSANPSVFLLYGGSVNDGATTIQCSGYTGLSDSCPMWRVDYASGSFLTLTATAWPGWRVSGWVGGDRGAPGNATCVTLTLNHNSNCRPQFKVIHRGPLVSPQICDARLAIGASPYTIMGLQAFPINNAPAGQFHWLCYSTSRAVVLSSRKRSARTSLSARSTETPRAPQR